MWFRLTRLRSWRQSGSSAMATIESLLKVGVVRCTRCIPEEQRGFQYRSGVVPNFCQHCQFTTLHGVFDPREVSPGGRCDNVVFFNDDGLKVTADEGKCIITNVQSGKSLLVLPDWEFVVKLEVL